MLEADGGEVCGQLTRHVEQRGCQVHPYDGFDLGQAGKHARQNPGSAAHLQHMGRCGELDLNQERAAHLLLFGIGTPRLEDTGQTLLGRGIELGNRCPHVSQLEPPGERPLGARSTWPGAGDEARLLRPG